MALTKITKTGITNDAIDETKIADDAISEEHLDNTAIIGHTELAEAANASDIFLVYDVSAGALKKILASNVGTQAVTVTSISPTNATSGDGTGNHTFTITGTNFTGASAEFVNNGGTIVPFDSVTVNSATQITGVIAKSSLPNSGEPYDIRVRGSNGLIAEKLNQVNVDASPTFVTAAGSLGTQLTNTAGVFHVNATDPDSAGNVTFELQSGALPPGYTLTNQGTEGGTVKISGTDSTTSSTTTYNFTLRAVDAASNTSSRSFSITSRVIQSTSFTSSGTFAVPSGVTTADVLVVAGGGSTGTSGPHPNHRPGTGGGGAGGLVYFPCYPLTPGGTVTVTVGCGAAGGNTGGNSGSDSVFGSPGNPGLGQGGVLTAKGGGVGGRSHNCITSVGAGGQGGSGGGGGYTCTSGGQSAGQGIQPTQPGNSGSYGFGNAGGTTPSQNAIGGGGGGAGAAGENAPGGSGLSNGGAGKAYTIADGTTPVYYAGGGAGGPSGGVPACGGNGGQGGGGDAGSPTGQAGQANKGGGGGGGRGNVDCTAAAGGKGIVIVRY